MRTNLIQTYMNNLDKKDRNLDIKYELSNRTFIKPLPADGKLIKNSVLESPAVWAKDTAYDLKSFYNTMHGKGNDHELGKVNDLGMKLGGLVIAGYLIARKQTPLKKLMELVGLASFFGAMSLWPKISLQLPARLIHGFNIRQEYEDSFGRKKMFFQDPQYIPWDLVSDERINKIGDRMGVSKTIPNRRDFIQEKMKKTAVQNNTLWMMTAGFATPIMSALICNASEKPLLKLVDDLRDRKAEKLLAKVGDINEQLLFDDSGFKSWLNKNSKSALTPEFCEAITKKFTEGFDDMVASGIKDDLREILGLNEKTYSINDDVIKNIEKAITKGISKDILPDDLKEILKEFLGRDLSEADIQKVLYKVRAAIKVKLEASDPKNARKIFIDFINSPENPLKNAVCSNPAMVLSKDKIYALVNAHNQLGLFRVKNNLLDEYIYLKAGAAPETGLANVWNEISGSLPKIFGMTDKEIRSARFDRTLAGSLLRTKLESIASDETKYNEVFKQLSEELMKLETRIKNIGANASYANNVDMVFNSCANSLREYGFLNTAAKINGKDGMLNGSLINIQKSYIADRLIGIRSSMYRLLNTLDFYRRIATLKEVSVQELNIPLEVKEEIVEFAKTVAINGTTSDFMTKFYSLRNPNPNTARGLLEVSDGKVINKFLDKEVKGGRVELPNDKKFFERIMRLLFDDNIHPDSDSIIRDTDVKTQLKSYREATARELGNSYYFLKPYHNVTSPKDEVSSYIKFLRTGLAPDQMLSGVLKETYNTRKWLKIFGGFGAGLLAVTLLSQFFFGRMKQPQEVKHD